MNDAGVDDAGIVVVLLDRMSTQCLPRALDVRARVEPGDRLGFFDLRFLEEVCAENFTEFALWEQHPGAGWDRRYDDPTVS